jgi:filamentous hemagglutinin family protein
MASVAALPAFALPQNPSVIFASPGQTGFVYSGAELTVNSSSRRSVIDWSFFDIARNETVTFNLPDGRSIVVNRVRAPTSQGVPSFIDGALRSNGNVWVLNQNGVIFGSGAQVDVNGLLASNGSLLDGEAFVNSSLDAPIAFGPGALQSQGVRILPGAQIVTRGGPAMFIATSGDDGQVYVGGSVQGGGSAQETASSQILYGAAGAFTLRFSETAPDAVGSSDLQLFDFIVDAPAVLGSGNGIDNPSILIDEGSITRAGNVSIISDVAQTTAQEQPEVLIRSSIEATSGDRTGSECSSDNCSALLIDSRNLGAVRFDRPRSQGQTGLELGDLVTISSAGSIDVLGSSILAFGDLEPESDYETVRFLGATRLFGRQLVSLHNAGLNGALVRGQTVDLINTFLDPLGGDIAGGSVSITGSLGDGPAADLTFGNIFAESGSVAVDTRGSFRAGDIVASGQVKLDAAGSIRVASLFGSSVLVRSSAGSINVSSDGGGQTGGDEGGSVLATDGEVSLDGALDVKAGAVQAAGDVKARSLNGTLVLGDVSAGGRAILVGSSGVQTGGVSAVEAVTIESALGGVSTGSLLSETGDVFVRSMRGSAVVGSVSAAGRIDLLTPMGTLSSQIVNAGGDVVLLADGDVLASSLEGASVDAQAVNGGIRVGLETTSGFTPGDIVSTVGDVRLTAQRLIEAGRLSAAARSLVRSSAGGVRLGTVSSVLNTDVFGLGALSLGDVSAGTYLAILSEDGAVLAGDVSATAGYARVSGARGVTTGSVASSNEVSIAASAGAVSAGSLLGGSDVAVDGRDGISIVSAEGRSVRLSSTAGGVTVGRTLQGVFSGGRVSAKAGVARLVGSGDVKAGDVAGSDGVDLQSLAGSISVRDAQSGKLMLLNGKTGVSSGGLSAGTGLDVFSDGAISAGPVSTAAGAARLKGGGDVTLGDASAGADLEIESRNGKVTAGGLLGVGAVRVTSAGQMSAFSVRGTGINITSSAANIRIGRSTAQGFTAGDIQAGTGGTSLSASSGVEVGRVNSASDVLVMTGAGSGIFGDIVATGRISLAGTRDLGAGVLKAGLGVSVQSSQGRVTTGDVEARAGDAILAGGAGVTAANITASGEIGLDSAAGAIQALSLNSGGALNARASTGFSAKSVRGSSVFLSTTSGRLQVGVEIDGFSGGAVTSTTGRTEMVSGGDIRTGDVTSGQAVLASATGGVLRLGSVSGAARVDLTGRDGLVAGAVTAGQGLRLASTAGDVQAGSLVSSGAEADVDASGSVIVGDVTAVTDVGLRSSKSSVAAGTLKGRELSVSAGGGDASLAGAEGRTLRITTVAGGQGGGAVNITGPVLLNSQGAPASETGIGLGIIAAGNVSLSGAVTSQRDVVIDAGGVVTIDAPLTVSEALGGVGEANSPIGKLYGGVDIRASDLSINASVSVRGAAGVNLAGRSQGGISLGDGIAGSSGMRVSNTELQRISAPSLALRGSLSQAGTGDVTFGSFTLDAEKVRALMATTGAAGRVRVLGTVSVLGAPSFQFGETDLSPGGVEISGAIGSSTSPLGALSFRVSGPVLIGSQAFIDLVNAAADPTKIDLAAVLGQLGTTDADKTYITAGPTSFRVDGVILQQNTGGSSGGGVRLSTPATSEMFASGASRIALFGTFAGRDGAVVSGPSAARLAGLLAEGAPPSERYRINGCIIGPAAGCGGGGDLQGLLSAGSNPPPPSGASGPGGDETDDEEGSSSSVGEVQDALAGGETSAGPISVDDTARDLFLPEIGRAEKDPGVGAANEDLWPQGL